MAFGIFFCALAFGGASSWLYFNQMCGKRGNLQTGEHLISNMIESEPLPSLYEADIDTLAKGLKYKKFTSVDLVNVSRLSIFE